MSEAPPPAVRCRSWCVWGNVLGLDAVLAALLWMKLFAWTSRTRSMVWEEYMVLGVVVWVLYMADRMMDGLMAGGQRQERHTFAARHWRWLAPAMLPLLGGCAWLLLYRVPESVSVAGLKLGMGVAIYYALTWVIRKNIAGLTGALAACGCLAVALMQGNILRMDDGSGGGQVWPHLWRGALAGLLLTVVLVALRRPGAPAPWLLPRKLMAGWIFALGTALTPFAHKEMWHELLFSPPVLVFAAVFAVNSLGIRLVEAARDEEGSFELLLLRRLYPWVMVIVAAGAFMEWHAAYAFERPLHGACAAAAVLLMVLYAARRRMPVHVYRALADAAVILPAAVTVLFFLKR